MGKWTRRIAVAIVILLAVAGAAYYWLIVESGAPTGLYALDFTEIRRLADSIKGDKAREIRVEHVVDFTFPATAVVAGDSWQPQPMTVFSYQIVFPDSTAIVDTAMSEKEAQGGLMGTFYKDAFARMSAGLTSANLIVITHEHPDHVGGLLTQPDLKTDLGRTKLNQEQYDNLGRYNPDFDRAAFAGYRPITYRNYLAIAPGVVLIRAAGHTPGSQMVYVKTASGQEFLFTGDVAWNMRNIDLVRERARLVTWLFLKEDRDAVLDELSALHAMKGSQPNIHIVPGHDREAVVQLESSGLLSKGFR